MSTLLRFSVSEYDRMIESGVFTDRNNRRLELVHGEIREMTPPNPPHEDTVDLLMYWSVDAVPRDQVRVRVQNSVGLPELDSVPEPDVAWLLARSYRRKRPQKEDVLLLIEVADSSLTYDRTEKANLYASAGIEDYWIVNLVQLRMEIHRQPSDGKYTSIQVYEIDESVSPLKFPDVRLRVGDVLGK